MAHIVVFLAEGFEETEAVSVIDLLRRATINVTTVSTGSLQVQGAHGMVMYADTVIDTMPSEYNGIVLPGGGSATKLLNESPLIQVIASKAFSDGLLCAAICAAPSVFGKIGILKGLRATCYPGFEDTLIGAKYIEAAVVRDRNVITSRGVGTAILFALELISYTIGSPSAKRIKEEIVY